MCVCVCVFVFAHLYVNKCIIHVFVCECACVCVCVCSCVYNCLYTVFAIVTGRSLRDLKYITQKLINTEVLLFSFCTESCAERAYHCSADKECTHYRNRCNYVKDCPSGGDEEGCRKKITL